MDVTTFGTLKGGVGKTMLCFNLAGILAQRGRRVLILDADLQGNLTNNMGIDRTRPGMGTAYHIFDVEQSPPPAQDLILKAPNPRLPTLDLIPGSLFLHKAELKMASAAGRELLLQGFLEDNAPLLEQYDHLLIDTNPSMSLVNQNAFLASDSILLVSDVSLNALEGAQLFLALWEETRRRLRRPDNVKGLIVNDFDGRNRLSADFLDYLRTAPDLEDLRALMLDTVIPRTVKITESELAAAPLTLFDPGNRGGKALLGLADELIRRRVFAGAPLGAAAEPRKEKQTDGK